MDKSHAEDPSKIDIQRKVQNEDQYPIIWCDPGLDSKSKKALKGRIQANKLIHPFRSFSEAREFARSLGISFVLIIPDDASEEKLFQEFSSLELTYGRRMGIFEGEEEVLRDLIQGASDKVIKSLKAYVFFTKSDYLHEAPINNEEKQEQEEQEEEATAMEDLNILAKEFRQEFAIILYDPDKISQTKQKLVQDLEIEIDRKNIFTNRKNVLEKVKNYNGPPYHLIMAGKNLDEETVTEVTSLKDLLGLYIYRDDDVLDQINHEKFDKAKTLDELIPKIKQGIRMRSMLRNNFPAFATDFGEWDRSHINYVHHYLKGLINFKNRKQAKEDFIRLAKKIYQDQSNLLFKFQDEYTKYNKEKILHWYTKDSPIYKMINSCLRLASSDSILYCRFGLKDMERAIRDQYREKDKNFNGVVYRGAYTSLEEWENLERNIGQEIVMYAFLSTTLKQRVALRFVEGDPKNKIFVIILVPPLPEIDDQGFTYLSEFSEFKGEEEILFNVRSKFQILQAVVGKIDEKGNRPRHLVLLYGAQLLRKHMTQHNPSIDIELELPLEETIQCHMCRNGKNLFGFQEGTTKVRCFDCLTKNPLPKDTPILSLKSLTAALEKNFQNFSEDDFYFLPGIFFSPVMLRTSPATFLDFFTSSIEILIEFNCLIAQPNNLNCNTSHFWDTLIFQKREKFDACFRDDISRSQRVNEKDIKNEKHIVRRFPGKMLKFTQGAISFTQSDYKCCDCQGNGKKSYFKWITQDGKDMKQCSDCFQKKGEIKAEILVSETYPYTLWLEHQKEWEKIDTDYKTEFSKSYQNINEGKVYNEVQNFHRCIEYGKKVLKKLKLKRCRERQKMMTYHMLGTAYESLASFQEAEVCFKMAVSIGKSVFDPFTITLYNKLADIDESLCRHDVASKNYREALKIAKLVYEEETLQVATSYNGLASVCNSKGQYKEAFQYFEHALQITKRKLGENHPETATSYNNMACVYRSLGMLEKAKEDFEKAFKLKIAIFGENHPEIVLSYHNHAEMAKDFGEYNTSVEYFEKSIKIAKGFYGEKHSQIAVSYNGLGNVFRLLEKYQEAINYCSQALELTISAKGETHKDTANVYNDLALVCQRVKHLDKALVFLVHALEINKTLYGKAHPNIATSYTNLALLYSDLKSYEEALSYAKESLDMTISIYGEIHGDTANSYNNLGRVYEVFGDSSKVIENYAKALKIYELVFGNRNHPETALVSFNLGCILKMQGLYQEAKDCLQKSYDMRIKLFGPENSETMESLMQLGDVDILIAANDLKSSNLKPKKNKKKK